MLEHGIWIAFGLTLIAGLSTGIGSLIALIFKQTNTKFLCASLGFSAGVMLYVSFMEILPTAKEDLSLILGAKTGMLSLLISFFGGIALITLIDFLIPKTNNPHELQGVEDMKQSGQSKMQHKSLHRIGIIMAMSVAIHNFPEGIAVFSSSLNGFSIAIPITIAIAIHNIPEGIAVSVPIYYATGNKKKAFWLSFLSGLSEPLGAVIAYLFLMQFWTPLINGIVLTAVAGIMVYISLDELLPTAEKYGEHHISISGLIAGMIVMALSLFFL
ncbi:MAG: zinc transporter ZupT [Tannerella sp.]|jgi:ZIP family zinc transporter|nr:zinc transporter ZupT [Tannerella sp.]